MFIVHNILKMTFEVFASGVNKITSFFYTYVLPKFSFCPLSPLESKMEIRNWNNVIL